MSTTAAHQSRGVDLRRESADGLSEQNPSCGGFSTKHSQPLSLSRASGRSKCRVCGVNAPKKYLDNTVNLKPGDGERFKIPEALSAPFFSQVKFWGEV